MQKRDGFSVRSALAKDAAVLRNIYAPYVLEKAVSFECALPSVEQFAARIASTLEMYPYLVAELDGMPVGYACAHRFQDFAGYDWSVETTIYVKRGFSRRGIGRRLHAALEACLKAQGVCSMNACIAHQDFNDELLNDASERFHAAMGYRQVAHFRKIAFVHGRWFDIVWMQKNIGDQSEAPRALTPFPELGSDELLHAGVN
ncbi:MAG: GNAT family N-acetyltransferase [Coriobacteriales bacterium]